MNEVEINGFLAAYQRGQSADMLQARTEGEWGPLFTAPPCSIKAMERAGRQFTRSRAQAVRHVRLARLKRCHGEYVQVMVISTIPQRTQIVLDLITGERLKIARYLTDDALEALESEFVRGEG